MKRFFLSLVSMIGLAQGHVSNAQIANMFVIGFDGTKLTPQSQIVKDVCGLGLGGVILFRKNVRSPKQVRALTSALKQCPHVPLIAVDQEGGKVRRIPWDHSPSAVEARAIGTQAAANLYDAMGATLENLGVNYNLAPDADLACNPQNYVIFKLKRSYSADPRIVTAFDQTFIHAMHKHHILTSLKHFPGHGSSLGDTHRGFVDASKQWTPQELKPFANPQADSVMVAHVVCDKITEPGRPASLSPRAISTLHHINPQAVVITDDLQMGAIRKMYGDLRQVIRLAINAGDDLLLFGNQLTQKHKVTTRQLVGIVRQLLAEKKISENRIRSANRRIERMRRKIRLRHRLSKTKLFSTTHQKHAKDYPKTLQKSTIKDNGYAY